MTSFGYLYQNKVLGICNNLNQFTHLSSATGPIDDVIKIAAKKLLMHIYTCTLDSKHKLCGNFLLESSFCLYLIDLVSSDTTMMRLFFSDPWNPF